MRRLVRRSRLRNGRTSMLQMERQLMLVRQLRSCVLRMLGRNRLSRERHLLEHFDVCLVLVGFCNVPTGARFVGRPDATIHRPVFLIRLGFFLQTLDRVEEILDARPLCARKRLPRSEEARRCRGTRLIAAVVVGTRAGRSAGISGRRECIRSRVRFELKRPSVEVRRDGRGWRRRTTISRLVRHACRRPRGRCSTLGSRQGRRDAGLR